MTQLRPSLVLFGLLVVTAVTCRVAGCGGIDPGLGEGGSSGSGRVNAGEPARGTYGAGCSPNLCGSGGDSWSFGSLGGGGGLGESGAASGGSERSYFNAPQRSAKWVTPIRRAGGTPGSFA